MAVDAPGERLQKVLAEAGLASRRQAEQWIRDGRVTVNGTPAILGQRVQPRDDVRVDGRTVRASRRRAGESTETQVFLCHRSPGDDLQQGLIPRLPRRAGRRFVAISPMPRIDGGLELVTSDGALAARLQRRVRDSIGEFSVRVRGDLNDAGRESLLRGQLDDGSLLDVQTLEASGEEGDASNRWYHLSAQGPSGKAIRQLFERQGVVVSRVMRTGLAGLRLTRDLGRGHFRPLTAEEAQLLEEAGAMPAAKDHSEDLALVRESQAPLGPAASSRTRSVSRRSRAPSGAIPRTERPRTERPRTERPRTESPRRESPYSERPRRERPPVAAGEGGSRALRRAASRAPGRDRDKAGGGRGGAGKGAGGAARGRGKSTGRRSSRR